MKEQDIVFFFAFLVVIFTRNPKLAIVLGLILLILSIPLFSFWVFFTAERFTWYAAAFFLLAIMFYVLKTKKDEDSES